MQPQALVGQVLGETYRIEGLLGKGGMGAVYTASHVRIPRRFAIRSRYSTASWPATDFVHTVITNHPRCAHRGLIFPSLNRSKA